MQRLLVGTLAVFVFTGCSQPTQTSTDQSKAITVQWNDMKEAGLSDYWYQGQAELNTYELTQNRYGHTHPGEAVLIFVTEDFRTDIQVKDDGSDHPEATTVLKTNYLRRFTTGLYDYSIMTSVFTPADVAAFPNTLKVTTSVQDWCGQVFMQVNKDRNRYRTKIFSYFESEGDAEENNPVVMLEDEIFNRIRMNPKALPQGKVRLLPGTAHVRLKHTPYKVVEAEASLRAYADSLFSGSALMEYRLVFENEQRQLAIVFSADPPYRIEGWIDQFPSMFDGKVRKTVARRKATELSPYWQYNQAADTTRRKPLEIRGFD